MRLPGLRAEIAALRERHRSVTLRDSATGSRPAAAGTHPLKRRSSATRRP